MADWRVKPCYSWVSFVKIVRIFPAVFLSLKQKKCVVRKSNNFIQSCRTAFQGLDAEIMSFENVHFGQYYS